ncbi:cation channel sperm-associated auxiliary subunit delta isoform X10 [Canis aureus]
MLVLMLVAATTLQPCLFASARQLCRWGCPPRGGVLPRVGERAPARPTHMVRTGKVFHVRQQIQGDQLYFSSMTSHLIKHPCKKNIALYLGRRLFFTRDNFRSSLLPLSIPTSMKAGLPEVTSAHIAGSVLLLVVSRKVYIYNYEANYWNTSIGIEHPVSHVSGDNCCYSGHPFCVDISNSVFAYLHGDQISQTNIYFSNNGGFRYQKFAYEKQAELVGSLGGIFYFHSLSQVGLLLTDQGKARFSYSEHPLNFSFGLPFDYNGTLNILITPGQKGILIFWFERSLLLSRNSGQLVYPVQVKEGPHTLLSSISEANVTIYSVAANEYELAVLTRENNLYYGSLGILSTSLIKFTGQNIWSQEAALMFTDVGRVEILVPLSDPVFPAFDFEKCPVNIQAILMDPQLQVDVCKVELLQGEFDNKMYTIDMNSELELTALMIPRPGMSLVPLAMVSNPHSLGLQAVIYEDGYTYDGNTRHRLLWPQVLENPERTWPWPSPQNISLRQQHHWGRADPNFTSRRRSFPWVVTRRKRSSFRRKTKTFLRGHYSATSVVTLTKPGQWQVLGSTGSPWRPSGRTDFASGAVCFSAALENASFDSAIPITYMDIGEGSRVFSAVLFLIAPGWKQASSNPSTGGWTNRCGGQMHPTIREAETQAKGDAGSLQGARCGTRSQDPGITP